nr:transposase [Caloramator sp. ALD01]
MKGYEVTNLLHALIAMQVQKIKNIHGLIERLNSDPALRYYCGLDIKKKAPSESTFSRFLDKLSLSDYFQKEFKNLFLKAKKFGIIDETEVAIDSTKLDSFESQKPKSNIENNDISPYLGKKKDTDGNDVKWFGWKAHIPAYCKSELPLNVIITPASKNDSILAITSMKQLKVFYNSVFTPNYYIMDSIYDIDDNYNYNYIIKETKGQSIIAFNKRGNYVPPEAMDDNLHPICSLGYKLTY